MSKRFNLFAAVATLTVGALVMSFASKASAVAGGDGPVVWVTGQNLYYDTIVLGELPPHGPFQLLVMGGPTGLMTEFGPGDRGYVGGRWWVDANGDGEMDPGDVYFLCPLLPPGREEP